MAEDGFSILALEGYLNYCDCLDENPQWFQCYCRISSQNYTIDIFTDETKTTQCNAIPFNNGRISIKSNGAFFYIFAQQDNEDIPEVEIAEFQAPSVEEANKWSEIIRTLTQCNQSLSMDDFNIISVLGRGFFGKVMLVEHKQTKELFALKTVRKKRLLESDRPETVIAERNIMMLIKNPFIIQLHFAFQTATKFYLGLEYAPGGELFYHMEQFGLIPVDDARLYIAEIAIALNHLHKLGIVYRDLKPENILFDIDGHVKLTDFGLAKALDENQSATTFCGTNHYLAPEIVQRLPYSYEIDWWALGVLLCEMLTGIAPFQSENQLVMFEKIICDNPELPSDVDEEAADLILQLLTKDPKLRPTFEDICVHPFFSCLDWDNVYNKRYVPNFVPDNVTSNMLRQNQSQSCAPFVQPGQQQFHNPCMQQSMQNPFNSFQQPPQAQPPSYMQYFQQTQPTPYMQYFQQPQQASYMQYFQQPQPAANVQYFQQPQQAANMQYFQQTQPAANMQYFQQGQRILQYFPQEFTRELPIDSQCDPGQSYLPINVEGFSFIAPQQQPNEEANSATDNGLAQDLQQFGRDSEM